MAGRGGIDQTKAAAAATVSDCQREGREQKFENRRRALQRDGQAELQGGGAGRWPEVRERRVGD